MVRLYVGNLPFKTNDEDMRALFEQFGEVMSASVLMDRETGRSRGFGFVEFKNQEDGANAIEQLDGQPFEGRPLKVNEARPREDRRGGGGGGGGGYGGGGGGGYRGGGGRDRDNY